MDHGCVSAKIVMGRWGGGSPFERGRFPRIVAGLCAEFHAPEKVYEKDELSSNGDKCRIGNEFLKGNQIVQVGKFGELRIAPWMAGHSQIVHGHETRIRANKTEREVPARQAFA